MIVLIDVYTIPRFRFFYYNCKEYLKSRELRRFHLLRSAFPIVLLTH